MNPTNRIDYPNYNPNNDDIFDKLIARIRTLQLMVDKNKKAWQYLKYAGLMIILAIITYLSANSN